MNQALEDSIKKWELIADGVGPDLGEDNCGLCLKHNHNIDCECDGCPILLATGKYGCLRAPYHGWINHHKKDHDLDGFPLYTLCVGCKNIAQNQVAFLKGLR